MTGSRFTFDENSEARRAPGVEVIGISREDRDRIAADVAKRPRAALTSA
jgi:hypothetical protein